MPGLQFFGSAMWTELCVFLQWLKMGRMDTQLNRIPMTWLASEGRKRKAREGASVGSSGVGRGK